MAVICKKRLHAFDDISFERRRRMLELANNDETEDRSMMRDKQAIVNDLLKLRERELRSTRLLRAMELACQVVVAILYAQRSCRVRLKFGSSKLTTSLGQTSEPPSPCAYFKSKTSSILAQLC